MKKPFLLGLLISALLVFFALQLTLPVNAAPQLQLTPFPTPTPGPDGRIVYIVQEGDTLWRIAAVSGVQLGELRRLNNLGDAAVIVPGQQLLLGLGGPESQPPTQGPPPTPTSELPTPTPGIGYGRICVLLFNDVNGDGIRQEEEPSIPGGAISINDRFGTFQLTAETPAGGISALLFPDPEELGYTCFDEIEQGEYNITVAIPEGYNATTGLSQSLELKSEDESLLDFGAQPDTETQAQAAIIPADSGSRSPLLGIAGVLLLLVGIGLGVSLLFRRR